MFTVAAQRFFKNLSRNNNKSWFEANRSIYETEVRGPLKDMVEELDARLAGFAPEIVGDPKRSLFRINRDIRFSKDKSPYKTNAGCWFYHIDAGRQVGKDSEGGSAGFYFHIDAKTVFVAGGIWMPPRQSLTKIRDAIAENPKTLSQILSTPGLKRRFGNLDQEARLTRVPRGYDPEHPGAEWLRYQSFTVGRELVPKQLTSPKLTGVIAKDFETMLPLVRWINRALGLPEKARR